MRPFFIFGIIGFSLFGLPSRCPADPHDQSNQRPSATLPNEQAEFDRIIAGSDPGWSFELFSKVATRVWGFPPEKVGTVSPAGDFQFSPEFKAEFCRRYRLRWASNYPNHGLPVGLTATVKDRQKSPGITLHCIACHGNVVNGQAWMGTPNPAFRHAQLLNDLNQAQGLASDHSYNFPMNPNFNMPQINNADSLGLLAEYIRSSNGKIDWYYGHSYKSGGADKDIRNRAKKIAFLATPPWLWTPLKEDALKLNPDAGLYADGGKKLKFPSTNPADVTLALEFHGSLNGQDFKQAKKEFAKIWPGYTRGLNSPKFEEAYPGKVDHKLAQAGYKIFQNNCAQCHGAYEMKESSPSLVPGSYLAKTWPERLVGTDPMRAHPDADFVKDHKELGTPYEPTGGYTAPPLRGLWATAPYLHNGSVPNLTEFFKSKRTPGYQTETAGCEDVGFDPINVGLKATEISPQTQNPQTDVYNPQAVPLTPLNDQPNRKANGLDNGGHPWGTHLAEDEKKALIEFLKLL
jgi:mono/diheme cytochrome c family protein